MAVSLKFYLQNRQTFTEYKIQNKKRKKKLEQ